MNRSFLVVVSLTAHLRSDTRLCLSVQEIWQRGDKCRVQVQVSLQASAVRFAKAGKWRWSISVATYIFASPRTEGVNWDRNMI